MPFQPCENAEPIPGYTLLERLGVGGYGEVWKVSAPGGLAKAMKFVYGRLNDDRGARELKALGRIKEVRHPFLLSLERFDIIDGQLFVLSELADMSLMDRFRECREAGLPGIPRDELLGHLRDAADALDYIGEKYGLQHLDIKPENLLLVGGRVKVADFGLVKDLQDSHATAIGGVTPIYATPEAFDGRASRQSDQYSLAIVFQEMLTGALPFPGQSTAQLATQHLHSAPVLSRLPERDRAAVGRALSKRPEARFPSCRSLIDCLLGRNEFQPAAFDGASVDAGGTSDGDHVQQAFSDLRSTPCSAHADETTAYPQNAEATLEDGPNVTDDQLQPLERHATAAGIRPTLFLGIGGTGARVLRRLRQRLHNRYDGEPAPCWQILLLDTDAITLRAAERGESGEALLPGESVYLPLRRPADYRAASDQLLRWLSRRWLYNIPRSLRTEGLRPLGRLAYVDHAEKVEQRIQRAIGEITSVDAKTASSALTGGGFRDETPRVFVVGSISGGAGGMLLDVAYAVRKILEDRGFSPDAVCGILAHGTMAKGAANDLRKANAYATLTELNHFVRRAGAGRGEPDVSAPQPPFGDTYLVDLGENLTETGLDEAADAVARYLYLDASTPCGAALDGCRELARQRPRVDGAGPRVRSFGLRTLTCDKQVAAQSQADQLCHLLVSRWHGAGPHDDVADLRLERPDLKLEDLARGLMEAANKALGGNAEVYARGLLAPLPGGLCAPGAIERVLEQADSTLGAPSPDGQPRLAGTSELGNALRDAAQRAAQSVGDILAQPLKALLDDPRGRLPAALSAANLCQEHLRALRQHADGAFREAQTTAARLRLRLERREGPAEGRRLGWLSLFGRASPRHAEDTLVEYVRWRVRAAVYQHLSLLVHSVAASVAALNEQFQRLRPMLEAFANSFGSAPHCEGPDATSSGAPSTRLAPRAPRPGLFGPECLLELDRRIELEMIQPAGGLLGLANADPEAWKALRRQLQLRARAAVLQSSAGGDSAALLLERYPDAAQLNRALADLRTMALPRLLRVGGAKRLLACAPDGRHGAALAEAIRQCSPAATLVACDAENDLIFCYEAEGVSLAKAAAALIENRSDYAAAARRVLTRVDVAWVSLPLVRQQPPADNSEGEPSEELVHGQC